MTAGTPQAGTDEVARVTLDAWLVTDVGVVRDHNEDSATMEPVQGFFIVADGMGGHAAGEVASAMAVETVKKTLEDAKSDIEAFKKAPTDAGRRGLVQLLQSAVLQAHQAVYQRGQTETDKQGMGTTLDVVLVAGAEAFVAHVGDSRTYLVRDGRSSQITTDHTVAEVLVIEGKLTIEEAQVSPLRTILVNAIGVSADVGVEMAHVTLKRNDRLLLCSDGLHDYFPIEEEIAQRLSADAPGDALKEMVELAKTRGGHDNITGVAVHVVEVVEAAPTSFGNEESTQPVDVGNPFAADEPTQTAFTASGVPAPGATISLTANPADHKVADGKATVPMRAVDLEDLGGAPTVPPPMRDKARADAKTDPSMPKLDPVTGTPKADAAKADAPKPDATQSDDGDEHDRTEVDGTTALDDESAKSGVPTEPLATADTGPAVTAHKMPTKKD